MAGKLKPTQLLYYGQTNHSQAYLPVRVDQTQAGTVSSWNSGEITVHWPRNISVMDERSQDGQLAFTERNVTSQGRENFN